MKTPSLLVLCAVLLLPLESMAVDLNLGARVQSLPAANRFALDGFHVWCGAPVKGPDGKYHLFYSRWPASHGFAPAWAIHSEVAYAVADKPEGPYRHVNVALPKRGLNPATGKKHWDADVTHNPTAFHHKGKYHIYYNGNHGDGEYWSHRNHQRVGLATAENPAGPWKRLEEPIIDITDDRKSFDSLCVTNPAACIRPDGGVLVIYKAVESVEGVIKGGRVRYGAAIADQAEGPYRKVPGDIFNSKKSDGKEWMLAEDPFIWFSTRYGNQYYAVTRDAIGLFTGDKGAITMFESRDGLIWRPSAHPLVVPSKYEMADGSFGAAILERPALLLDNDEPVFLFGAADGHNVANRPSSNVQFPISRPDINAPAVGEP